MKRIKVTSSLLFCLSLVTFINMAFVYFIPITLPFSNFTILKLIVIAFIEERYYLIGISVLLNAILLISSKSIICGKLMLPMITGLLYLIDLISVTYLFLYELINNQYAMWVYLPTIFINLIIMILMIKYLISTMKMKKVVGLDKATANEDMF